MEDLTPFAGTLKNQGAALSFYLILVIQAAQAAALLWLLQFTFKHTPGFMQYYAGLLRIYKDEARPRWLREIMKPLGLCIYCQSPYFAAGIFIYFHGLELVNMLLFIGATYFFVELSARVIHPAQQNESKPEIRPQINIYPKAKNPFGTMANPKHKNGPQR